MRVFTVAILGLVGTETSCVKAYYMHREKMFAVLLIQAERQTPHL